MIKLERYLITAQSEKDCDLVLIGRKIIQLQLKSIRFSCLSLFKQIELAVVAKVGSCLLNFNLKFLVGCDIEFCATWVRLKLIAAR